MFIKVPGTHHIKINEYGVVKNAKTGNILNPYVGTNGYMYIKFCEFGECNRFSIHRAVAMCFCDGYSEELVVDHIDGDRQNNYYKNLRWCSQKDNLKFGYKRRNDDPVRNCNSCYLYVGGKFAKEFRSIREAARHASKKYNCSYSMLVKHLQYNKIKIVKCND